MSEKRTSSKANDDEEGIEEDRKRAHLVSVYDTTLQDLPFELIECILIKVVAMEVKGMKLAKSVWNEKAELVINRLADVCSQWSSVLSSGVFRTRLDRALESDGAPICRFEVLHQSQIALGFIGIASFQTDWLIIRAHRPNYEIYVHDSYNLSHVKQVLILPGIQAHGIAVCRLNECFYVLVKFGTRWEMFKGTKTTSGLYDLNIFVLDILSEMTSLSVSSDGLILVYSNKITDMSEASRVLIYYPSGVLHKTLDLHTHILGFLCVDKILVKENGHFLLSFTDSDQRKVLTELDSHGSEVRRFISDLKPKADVIKFDKPSRILLCEGNGKYEFLDFEFNLLPYCFPVISGLCARLYPVGTENDFVLDDITAGHRIIETLTTIRLINW